MSNRYCIKVTANTPRKFGCRFSRVWCQEAFLHMETLHLSTGTASNPVTELTAHSQGEMVYRDQANKRLFHFIKRRV